MNEYFIKRECCPGCYSKNCQIIYSSPFLEPAIEQFLVSAYAKVGKIELEYLSEAKYILEECLDCKLIYQQRIPNDLLMKKLYQEWIDPYITFKNHERDDTLGHFAQYAQEVIMLVEYFNTIPSQLDFFDFGMGWGKWCQVAQAFGCKAYGSEISLERINYAKSRGITVISWDEIPYHQFDFINAEQVFEHIPHPLDTLCHLKKALKPHGLIKVSVPNGVNIKRNLKVFDWTAPVGSQNSLNPVMPLEHINCFTYNSLVQLADRAGLKPIKIPILIQFTSSTYWKPVKALLKNMFRPLYRNMVQKNTYLFFSQK